MCPCTHLRLRMWSRETGSAVPSRASLLVLHTLADVIPLFLCHQEVHRVKGSRHGDSPLLEQKTIRHKMMSHPRYDNILVV